MNTTPMAGELSPREAFYELSMAKHIPDAALLDDVVHRYPQFAEELTDFAIKLALDALQGEATADAAEAAVDPGNVSPAVSRAMSRFHNRLHAVRREAEIVQPERALPSEPVINPFEGIGRQEYRDFVKRIGVNSVLVNKLRDRQIQTETIPEGFKRRVAEELDVPFTTIDAHFAASGGPASASPQFFKADDKPSHDRRQSFEDAVRNSGLTDEQQQYLLSL